MEIYHSRRHCSVCQQINVVFSDEDKILIKTHEYTRLHSYMRRGIKIGALKMQLICIFFYICWISAEIWIFNFPSSVATYLRWGGQCRIAFVANFIRFPAMQNFWKLVKIWQSYRKLNGGNFFETQCIIVILTYLITRPNRCIKYAATIFEADAAPRIVFYIEIDL